MPRTTVQVPRVPTGTSTGTCTGYRHNLNSNPYALAVNSTVPAHIPYRYNIPVQGGYTVVLLGLLKYIHRTHSQVYRSQVVGGTGPLQCLEYTGTTRTYCTTFSLHIESKNDSFLKNRHKYKYLYS
jgi:hypothetical protein